MPVDLPLRDIHLPDAVSWFPPAIGWWLALLLIVMITVLLWRLANKPKQSVISKRALMEIESVVAAYQEHSDRLLFIQSLSAVLKRIGMSYFPRDDVAWRSGAAWVEQLNGLTGNRHLDDLQIVLLATAPYQRDPRLDDNEIDALITQLRRWATELPRTGKVKSDV